MITQGWYVLYYNKNFLICSGITALERAAGAPKNNISCVNLLVQQGAKFNHSYEGNKFLLFIGPKQCFII